MTSSEGEGFAFRSVVPVEGAVETWMTAVEAEMRRTLAAVMKEGECACHCYALSTRLQSYTVDHYNVCNLHAHRGDLLALLSISCA